MADDRRKFPELQTGEVVVRGGFHTGSTRSLPTARIVTVRKVPQTMHMQAGEQMKRRRLGGSGITVSEICMGTMTFGSQCDETLSFRIMDRARDAGIDFSTLPKCTQYLPRPKPAESPKKFSDAG